MGVTRRTVALSRYLAALNDGENGDNNSGLGGSEKSGDAVNEKLEEQLCDEIKPIPSESMTSCDFDGVLEFSSGDEESREVTQHVESIGPRHIHHCHSTGASRINQRTSSSKLQLNNHHQRSGSSPPRNTGNKETFIVDSSILLKKSKVWGAAASSAQKTGKHQLRSHISDRHGSNDNYDTKGGVVHLGSGVPTTVSGDSDHVTIASDMSGLTPASHLHTPISSHHFPPLTQQVQQRQQPSQPDLAAGGSTSTPLVSSHSRIHQIDNSAPPPHNNYLGKQHRNSRHHWPPTPPKTQPHLPLNSSSQVPLQVPSPSSTPTRSTPNQEKDRRSKRGDLFSKPYQNESKSTYNTQSNQESTSTTPRWKQKGAMLTIDTGISKHNSSMKDHRMNAKTLQNPSSTFQPQEQKTASHTIRQTNDDTNGSSQPQTPESHDSPAISSNESYTTNQSPSQPGILDTENLEHQSNNSDKENNNELVTTTAATVDRNTSPIQQRITAWNQVGHQHDKELLEHQKIQKKRFLSRNDPKCQDIQGQENENHRHCQTQSHASCQIVSSPGATNTQSHQRSCYNSSHPPPPLEQSVNFDFSTQEEYNDSIHNNIADDATASVSPLAQGSSDGPSPVAEAAAEVAAELVRRGGKSPKAAAAFLAAIQSGRRHDIVEQGDENKRSKQQRQRCTEYCSKDEEKGQVGILNQDGAGSLARNEIPETTTRKNTTMSPKRHKLISQEKELINKNNSKMRAANSFVNEGTTSTKKNKATGNIRERLVEEEQSQTKSQDLVSPRNATDVAVLVDAVTKDHSSNSTNFENQVQASLHDMEVRMEARMLRLEARLEAQLKARLEYMEAKMDARMDEIQSILQLMLTAGTGGGGGGGGGTSRGGGSLDEDYEV